MDFTVLVFIVAILVAPSETPGIKLIIFDYTLLLCDNGFSVRSHKSFTDITGYTSSLLN